MLVWYHCQRTHAMKNCLWPALFLLGLERKTAKVLVVQLTKHQGNEVILTNNCNWTEKIMYLSQHALIFWYFYSNKNTHRIHHLVHKSSIIYTDLASGNIFFVVFVQDLLCSVSWKIDSGQGENLQTPIVSQQAKIRPPGVWMPEDKTLSAFSENSVEGVMQNKSVKIND